MTQNPPAGDGTGASVDTPTVQRLELENATLFDTVQHFLNIHEALLELRGVRDAHTGCAIIEDLLHRYLDLRSLEVYRRDGSSGGLLSVFRNLPSDAPPDGDPTTRHLPFTEDEIEGALAGSETLIKEITDDGERYGDAPTVVLSPLIFHNEVIGFAVLGIGGDSSTLFGARLEAVDFLLRDLAAFIGTLGLSSSLQRATSLNRRVIESVRQGMFVVDSRGNVVSSNPAARVYMLDTTENRRFEDALEPDLVPLVRGILESKDRTPVSNRRVEVRSRDGRSLPLSVDATPIELEGGFGWIFLFQDYSVNVELENLRKLDALKSDFVLGLLHDMRTPLTGVVNGCDLLRSTLETPSADQEDLLRIIQASADRLQSLAGEILEMSALESAAPDESMEPADLVEIAERTVEPFALQASKHAVRLHTPEEPIVLVCQPKRIARVLENLIGNALKYSPYGGDVDVTVRRREKMAEIVVRDHGVGIKRSDLPHIWERFRRGKDLGGVTFEGTGLGLSIIKMIVDHHRGRVNVESELGKGSTFTVELPLLGAN